ncbi:Hint domain-containing protein [Salipiger bermudensis]|uniref:Hint domain-containing protein n=1 Tax=Salipiger bermudensis TaxID=344736 RepID=UPI001CD286AD|nr:Hint domain-containing protein [Salipiger bermudensis]MCA0960880.1 Hint domain-containing protein [Salipiger bermudensis]
MADLVLDWSLLGAYGTDLENTASDGVTASVETGGVAVDITYTAQDEGAQAFTVNFTGYVPEGSDTDANSHLKLLGAGGNGGGSTTATSTTVLNFSSSNELYGDEVQNVSFLLNDVDGGAGGDLGDLLDYTAATGGSFEDNVTVLAYDAQGNPVDVTLTALGAGTSVDGDTATGSEVTDFAEQDGTLQVSIAGPVSRIEIVYANGGDQEQGVLISDVDFSTTDPELPPEDDGNRPPEAIDDMITVTASEPETFDPSANDTDPDGDTLTITSVGEAQHGSVTLNPDGTVTYVADEGFNGNDSYEYTIDDGHGGTDTGNVTIDVLPCFTPGTLIATPQGERLVEDLEVGDRVITRDNGIQQIRWIGRKELTGFELSRKPHLKPVLIQQGALGKNLPEHDLLVSPNHRVLVANDKTALYFEEREVLAAAKHLTGLDGVDEVETLGVTYIHMMFDTHEVVLSNGAWTESFQPGDLSLRGIGDEQRQEIFELFPELEHAEGLEAYGAARRSLKKHEAQLLTA